MDAVFTAAIPPVRNSTQAEIKLAQINLKKKGSLI
jgi:hypothetical protein